MKYPGLLRIPAEDRARVRRGLMIQDRHLCYFLSRHEEPCWATEHRPIVPGRAGNYCDRRYIRSPYYGDELWKIRYWRKAVTG